MIHPLAGVPAPQELLVDPVELIEAYKREPDPRIAEQRVAFGTSGHRGCSLRRSFNEAHIAAITQAICDFRRHQGIHGPVFLGNDTHALSAPAESTVLEVLAGNGVQVNLQAGDGFAPTPAVSHAVITHNQASPSALADGVIVTPSHNPPEDGGLKYNPPHGGPADTDATKWIESRANQLLSSGNASVLRLPYPSALAAQGIDRIDFVSAYVQDLDSIIDMAAIRAASLKIGVAPMGGASTGCWPRIARHSRTCFAGVGRLGVSGDGAALCALLERTPSRVRTKVLGLEAGEWRGAW